MLLLVTLGLVPAIVLFGFVSFEQDQLVVSGTNFGSGVHSGTLGVALASLFSPLMLLAPPAFAWIHARTGWFFWLCVSSTPIALTAPGVLAACLQGSALHFSILTIWIWLGILMVNLTLWCKVGLQFLSPSICLILWGIIWVTQGFLTTLADYLLPNLDLGFWAWLPQLKWILPPVGTGIQAVDQLAHQNLLGGTAPISWTIQLVMLVVVFKLTTRAKNPSEDQPIGSSQESSLP